MGTKYRIERVRGTKESQQQLSVLREKSPLAFPVDDQDVRPLAIGAARKIAAATGWPLRYKLGVLRSWKMAPVSDLEMAAFEGYSEVHQCAAGSLGL